MGALRDPKLERFAQELLKNIASGMAPSKAQHAAGRSAGYTGKSADANSRKRAQRKDVKARMVELAAPAQAEREAEVIATVDDANKKLGAIAGVSLEKDAVNTSDQIAAINLLAKINGWMAPEKREVSQHGRFIISERPMSEAEWEKERASA